MVFAWKDLLRLGLYVQGLTTIVFIFAGFTASLAIGGGLFLATVLAIISAGLRKKPSFFDFMWAVILILIVIIFYAVFYYLTDSLKPNEGFIDAIYMSAVTFSTLGYGDMTPQSTQGKIFAASEGLIGNFFMALLAVKFTLMSQKSSQQ